MINKNKVLFESLHAEFQPLVLQMCLGFVKGDLDLAKDLAQDVFINIWNALSQFKGTSGYKTWIYRVTVNTCLKFIRDRKDKNNIPLDKLEEQLTVESNTFSSTHYDLLYGAIGHLNEVDRLIIMMVLDELEYEEISDVIGISAINLRVKIHRIKNNLKKALKNERSY
jgi:RNA polymerase sigma factor (sigma-70 family)